MNSAIEPESVSITDGADRAETLRTVRVATPAPLGTLRARDATYIQRPNHPIRNPLIADIICESVSGGRSLIDTCDHYGWSRTAVYDWRASDPEFAARLDCAMAILHDLRADDLETIALTETDPRRAANRIAARKWLLSKRDARYADKLEIESKNMNVNADISPDPLEAARQYAELMRGA